VFEKSFGRSKGFRKKAVNSQQSPNCPKQNWIVVNDRDDFLGPHSIIPQIAPVSHILLWMRPAGI
jgi:hypothetical protein